MILLQVQTEPISIYGILVTDWIQALASLVAVMGAIWAFVKLFIRDRERENEINSLITLAREGQLQTQQLISQTIHMAEANRLMREQVEIFWEQLKIHQYSNEQEQIENKSKKKIRKNDIMPRFDQANGGTGTSDLLNIFLINMGGQAEILDVDIATEDMPIQIDKRLKGKSIPNREEINLPISSNLIDLNKARFDFKILMRNLDGDKYSQTFKCQGMRCKPDYPVEIIEE